MKNFQVCLVLVLLTALWCRCVTAQVQQPQADRLLLGDPTSTGVDKCIANSWNQGTFAETVYVDDGSLPIASDEEKQRGYLVFQRHWMNLIFPVSIPKTDELTSRLSLVASPGEYEPASFCIRTLKELKGLQLSASELVSEDGHRIAAPQIRIVRCVPRTWQGEEWLYQDGPVGVMNMPTYLESPRVLDIARGRTVQFWVTVKVERDANPGAYQGEIYVRHEEGPVHVIAIEIDVQAIALAEPSQTLGFWDYQRPYKNEIGTLDQVYNVMREHGIRAVHSRGGLFTYDKNTDTYDFSKHISIDDEGKVTVNLAGSQLGDSLKAAKQAGFRYLIYNSHLFIFVDREVKARYDESMLANETAEEIARVIERFRGDKSYEIVKKEIADCSKNYPTMYSKPYADLFIRVIRGLLEEVEKEGYPSLIFPSWDEAFSNHHRNKDVYPFVLRHLELFKRAGGKTELNHCSPFSEGEYGAYVRAAMEFLDIAMPAPRLSSNPHDTSGYHATLPQLVEAYSKKGIATYNYSLSGQAGGVHPDMNMARFCAGFFFHSSKGKGLQGNFDYIFYRVEVDPYNPIAGHHWSHERLWFFPPQPETSRLGGRTITLAAKREGYDDLRYLHTLNKLIQQAQATADMPNKARAARRASAVRDHILNSLTFDDDILDSNHRNLKSRWDHAVVDVGTDSTISGSLRLGIGWDYETYDRHRRDLAEEIIGLQTILSSN